jgi:hypothetical protein
MASTSSVASGYGIMASLGAAELLGAHVAGAALPPYAPELALARYQDRDYLDRLPEIPAVTPARAKPRQRARQPLKPAAHLRFVFQILGTEPALEVTLLPRNHEEAHEAHGCGERAEQPDAVEPASDPEHED